MFTALTSPQLIIPQQYGILKDLRMDHGLAIASLGGEYHHVWIRDNFYMLLPYLDKDCGTYEKGYHTMLDIFLKYEWKIDIHTRQKPNLMYEYIHPRYSKYDLNEINQEWGNCQHDAIGAFLWGVGAGEKAGKKILRDEKDKQLIQKLVWYLQCCQYWIDPDNGVWEEWREIHSSSVGACVSGLTMVRDIVFVPADLIMNGWKTLGIMFSQESASRPVDLAQLTLIYPFNIYMGLDAETVIDRVETTLLRDRGVARYEGDSYYFNAEQEGRDKPLAHYYGGEAEWCFGISWLGLAHLEVGNVEKARHYLNWSRSLILENGYIPELYFANTDKPNPNTPLGWSSAMHIILEEKLA
jgi:phosphorylase kinase alpha/beta subunit